MASPLAKGLFHRAIGQSGGSFSPPGRAGGGSMRHLDDAERFGRAFADRLGARSIAELRSMSADDIQLKLPDVRLDRPWPIIDRRVIPDDLYALFSRREQHDVPLLTGSNADEGATRAPLATARELRERTRAEVGADADALVAAYIDEAHGDAGDASRRLGGHITFTWQNWTWARLHARVRPQGTFYYRCTHRSPLPAGLACCENAPQKLGTFHTAELPYVFRTLAARNWPWRDADRDLSQAMSTYWINFAAAGDPNGPGLPAWTPFDPDAPQAMGFGPEVAMASVPEATQLAALDRLHAVATRA
jgi:para-nitrobenzyl esterase